MMGPAEPQQPQPAHTKTTRLMNFEAVLRAGASSRQPAGLPFFSSSPSLRVEGPFLP